MPNTTKLLSDTEIKHAKPRGKIYSLADGKGLYLKVKPSGYKVWIFNFIRPFIKKRAAVTLGEYPILTLAKARIKRDEYRRLLIDDIDPIEHEREKQERIAEKTKTTLEAVTNRWIQAKSSRVSNSHAEDIYRSLELHIFSTLGKLPIHRIRAKHVIEVLDPIAAKGSLETVKRLTQRLNEIMVYAVNTDLVAANCLSGVSKAFSSPKKTHMPTLAPEQLPELMRAIANASIKKTTRCLIEWQLHTMTRPGEASGTKWEEIDFEKNLWAIPAIRMKKKRPHKVPLSPQTLVLLEVMKPVSANRTYIFPADRNPRTHTTHQLPTWHSKEWGTVAC